MKIKTKIKMPQTTSGQLSSIIKSCRDIMRKDKGLNGDSDRLPMLTWIMFLKFLDDMEKMCENESKMEGKRYASAIQFPYRWRDWAAKEEGITGEDLISFINNDECVRPDGSRGAGLFSYLKNLEGSKKGDRRTVISTVFRGTINRMQSGYLLRDVINKINGIHFTSTEEIYTLSHLYESLLKEMRDSAGDAGEFYTPRAVVKFMVTAVNPRLGETVLDPSCGTGGFLVEAFEHIRKQCKSVEDNKILQNDTISGGEAKSLPYLLCQMNLLLHGLEAPTIDSGNSLRFPLNEIGDKDRVDIIVTNPPFGGEEEKGIQGNFPQDKQTGETALLFLQLIMRKLKRKGSDSRKGGHAAVIVPNGTLFGDGVSARIKEELLKEFNLHTIVRLPNGVFAPYTGIATNILFFNHGGPTKEICYYEQPLPEERKNYTKTQPIQFDEFKPCLDWWKKREDSEQAWKVKVEDVLKYDANGVLISANLDITNPKAQEEFRHLPPEQIIKNVLQKEQLVIEIIKEIGLLAGKDNELFSESQVQKYGVQLGKLLEKNELVLNKETRNPQFDENSDEFVYIDISSVERGPGTINTGQIIKSINAPSRARRVVRENDVIFSTVRPNLRAIAKIGKNLDGQICSTGFAVFSCSKNILQDFLLYQLSSAYFINQCITRGAHYPAINDTNLRKTTLVIPPLEIQAGIVVKLTKFNTIEKKLLIELKQVKKGWDALLPAVIYEAFKGAL